MRFDWELKPWPEVVCEFPEVNLEAPDEAEFLDPTADWTALLIWGWIALRICAIRSDWDRPEEAVDDDPDAVEDPDEDPMKGVLSRTFVVSIVGLGVIVEEAWQSWEKAENVIDKMFPNNALKNNQTISKISKMKQSGKNYQ